MLFIFFFLFYAGIGFLIWRDENLESDHAGITAHFTYFGTYFHVRSHYQYALFYIITFFFWMGGVSVYMAETQSKIMPFFYPVTD